MRSKYTLWLSSMKVLSFTVGLYLSLTQVSQSFPMSSNRHVLQRSRARSIKITSLTKLYGQKSTGNILILDHLNINHEKGRHDWLKAFYFDFLKCAVDPRKEENLELGQKTLWANIGSNQFHLPEGKPHAQVLQGIVTLAYPNISTLLDRNHFAKSAMVNSKFSVTEMSESELHVVDPWGTKFRIFECNNAEDVRDSRGKQPGAESEGISMTDLTIYVGSKANLPGIARFYTQILGAPASSTNKSVTIDVGPSQTLTFLQKLDVDYVNHAELIDSEEGPSNYGAHISMYVADLPKTYEKSEKLGVTYVNNRFKRRAYSKDEAIDQCMFRIIDIIDPSFPENGPILKLEHEIRSVVKRDGSKYKSCPLNEIPQEGF